MERNCLRIIPQYIPYNWTIQTFRRLEFGFPAGFIGTGSSASSSIPSPEPDEFFVYYIR
jgi:hypothetical protein